MTKANRSPSGFTLVELITIIALLGILSAVAIARSGSNSDFEPRIFVSMAAEQYRFAHGLSTGRFGDPISFQLSATSATDWAFATLSGTDGLVRNEALISEGLSISVTNGSTTTMLGASDELRLQFSPSGDVLTAAVGTTDLLPNLGIQLTAAGKSVQSLCIYPTGYLGIGNCA